MLRSLILILSASFFLTACTEKKRPSLSGDEPVEINDFIESFELVLPPVVFADSTLNKKISDSFLINRKIFSQFVPDSVLVKIFGKNAKPKIYIGKRVQVEKKESYLFVQIATSDKKAVVVLCFDHSNIFKAYLPLLINDTNPATSQQSGLDRRYSFFKSTILKKPDGTIGEGKEVYIYSEDAGRFILIMTDALDDRIREVINPIDTLPRKGKYSADYIRDKMNIVSVRDGNKAGKIDFFIHFDRNDGACTGELKGSAIMTNANTAVYKQPGDACSLELKFSTTSVTLKEMEPCGTHRGVKCSFDGSYPRKKEPKKFTKKK